MTSPPQRHRCIDWAVAMRPMPGEDVSGDMAMCIPCAAGTLLVAVDGLGHGSEAAHAAQLGLDTIAEHRDESLTQLFQRVHAKLQRTRGATMTLARVDCRMGTMTWAGIGNVESRLVRRIDATDVVVADVFHYGGAVGYRLPSVKERSVDVRPGDLVIMASDGVNAAFTETLASGQSVGRLASTILARHARDTDDALVAVARLHELGTPQPPPPQNRPHASEAS